MKMVKKTIDISMNNYEGLNELISEKVISSIDDGVNLAIEMLLNENKKELYRQALKEAASDNDFLERTLECQKEFDEIGF